MSSKYKNSNVVYRGTTRRYLLAVLIIAILSTSAYYTLHSALTDSEATAYIVNLSGRQRMLSQHIALDSHRFHQAEVNSAPLVEATIKHMYQNISDMRLANRQLSSGVLADDQTIDLSKPIREMYFGEQDIHNRVNNYLNIAETLLSTNNHQARSILLQQIDNASEQLLIDLNSVVKQYQIEGEARLAKIEDLELLVWLATLVVLLLEVLLIFKPMSALIRSSQEAQTRTLESLEEMVELRTLKLELANQKLKEVAIRDPLTKLKNRLTLESDVEELLKTSKEHHIPFAICMIDIDWFKKVNDSYGHPAGDCVLQEIANLLVDFTREYDHLYRAGGEEFVLIINRVKLDEASSILDKLRDKIEHHSFYYEQLPISITISAGLYHSSQFESSSMPDIMRITDHALYAAKHNGRNCIYCVKQDDISILDTQHA